MAICGAFPARFAGRDLRDRSGDVISSMHRRGLIAGKLSGRDFGIGMSRLGRNPQMRDLTGIEVNPGGETVAAG